MNLDLMKAWLTRWEGSRAQAYDDATGKPLAGQPCIGNPTIGVGLNLRTATACSAITALGLDFEGVLAGHISLTAAQIDALLSGSINDALASARALLPAFDGYPDNQQLVLVDLTFNMGQATLGTFHQFLGFVAAQNWTRASLDLRGTEWFGQVGSGPNQRGGADVAVLAGADPQQILAQA